MSDQEARKQRLEQLRQRAMTLSEAQKDAQTLSSEHNALVESLQIYQAELELQNEELIESQTQLQWQVHRYRSLFHSLPTPSFLLDDDHRVLDVNDAGLALLKRSKRQLKGASLLRFMTSDAANWVKANVDNATSNDLSSGETITLIDGDSAERHCRASITVLPRDNPLHGRCLLGLMDVTAEVLLERERSLFNAVLDNTPSMVFVLDEQFNVLMANREMRRHHRLPLFGAIKESAIEFLPTTSVKRLYQHFDTLYLRGLSITYEYEYMVKDRVYYMQTSAFPMLDKHGKITAAGFITSDVTEKMDAEIRLQTAMTIFREGSEGIMITDADTRILSVNAAFESITGYMEEEVLGKLPSVLSSGKHADAFYANLWQQVNQQGHWEGEVWNRRKNGEAYPQWLSISRVPKYGAIKNYIGVFADISERKQAEAHIEQLAFYDSLTGTANRNLLRDRVEHLIRQYERTHESFSLIFIDLDKFKEINDVHGHDIGDAVLREVAKRIQTLFREVDTISRLGGDEFVVLMPNTVTQDAVVKVSALLPVLEQSIQVEQLVLSVTASAGVINYPIDGESYSQLLQHADLAMYNAKANGKNQFSLFEPSLIERTKRRAELTNALRDAMANGEFHLVYQPILGANGEVRAVEALVRWVHPLLGQITPVEFIPILEENGNICDLGEWILMTAIDEMASVNQQREKPLYCCINISAVQFFRSNFIGRLEEILKTRGTAAQHVIFEITERIAMQEPSHAADILRKIKQLGIQIALDDFGTGYSSLAYLKYLPIDLIKIDKSFVKDIGVDKDDEEICKVVIALSKALGVKTIAEGVEHQHQADFLSQHGCDFLQGYLFAYPVKIGILENNLQTLDNRFRAPSIA